MYQTLISSRDATFPERHSWDLWRILFIPTVLSMVWLVPVLVDETFAWTLVKEDGFYENCSFLFLVVSSMLFLLASINSKELFARLWFCFFFLMTFFGAGEEISWGQRIFGWNVSEASINVQRETTIHNLPIFDTVEGGLLKMSRLFMLFCLGWGLGLPVLYRFVPFVKSQVDRFRVPVIPIAIGIFFLVNIIASKIYQFTVIDPYVERIAEVREATQAMLLFVASLWFLRSVRTSHSARLLS